MKKALAVIIIASIILIGAVSAEESIPMLPAQFYGTALTSTGNEIPAGTEITSQLDGVKYFYTMTENGKIGTSETFGDKLIIQPQTPPSQNLITFYIGSVKSEQTATFSDGKSENIALTFNIEAKTKGTEKEIITKPPVVISENALPSDFTLTVNAIPQTEIQSLPKISDDRKVLKIIEITPENAPTGDYTVILTITLSASEISSLGVSKERVVVLHHNEAQNKWDELRTEIKSQNADGSVDYLVWVNGFSAFAIGTISSSAPTNTNTNTKVSSGGSSSATVKNNQPQTITQTQTSVPAGKQTESNTETITPAESKPAEDKGSDNIVLILVIALIVVGLIAVVAIAALVRRR